MCAGTGSSPPEVFAGRREIPQSLKEGIQEPRRVCWEQQHCLHQASCLAQWYQDVPKCSSLTTSELVWSPNRATAPPSSAAKPQPLLHCWHRGHRAGCCRHRGEQGWLWRLGWKAATQQAKWLWMGAGDTTEGSKQEPSQEKSQALRE